MKRRRQRERDEADAREQAERRREDLLTRLKGQPPATEETAGDAEPAATPAAEAEPEPPVEEPANTPEDSQ